MSDQRITCVDCGQIFTWTEGEQRFYRERGLHPPKHCRECRAHRRAAKDTGMHGPVLSPPEPLSIPKELRATADRLSGRTTRPTHTPRRPRRRTSPIALRFGGVAFLLAAITAVALHIVIADSIFAWLVAINVITFLTYGYDKGIAGSKMMRVPETVLLTLAIAGGSIGALAGMRLFRHKTAKADFQFKFVLIVIVQIVVLFVIYGLLRR